MPGKEKKNQKNTEVDREKVELTPEQKQALARKEYMNSLKHIRNLNSETYWEEKCEWCGNVIRHDVEHLKGNLLSSTNSYSIL